MIVTLTAHPALDRTIDLVSSLRVGEVHTARDAHEHAGGKGINVSRVVHAAGAGTVAVLPLAAADPFAAVLAETGLTTRPVPVRGTVRTNITLTAPDGQTTKINVPGAALSAEEAAALTATVAAAAGEARWVVLAGSLPPGVGEDFYVRVIEAIRFGGGARTPRIAVDTSGPALAAVVDAGVADLIKPNDEELVELTGLAWPADADAADAVVTVANGLVPGKVGSALVTLGAAGAVLVTREGAWAAAPPPIRARSTVGAGDSTLAGYLLAEAAGADPAECLRHSIRYGAAATSLVGTQAPTPADLPPGDVPVRALTR